MQLVKISYNGNDLTGDPINSQSTSYSCFTDIGNGGQYVHGYISSVSSSNFIITFNNVLSIYPYNQNIVANTFWIASA